ncbi:hypothetical protein AB0D78_44825 [Streptomyces avermitilis]|uniref:hypothetical protein n=1 Tax=Streptomyces avermitilis TaxID=33903 RepID=UPI0033D445D7
MTTPERRLSAPAIDHEAVRITDAPRYSPHILSAAAEPGDDDTVIFTTPAGTGFTLTLRDEAEPTDDHTLPAPVLTEAVATAILNHRNFVVATPDSPCEDTITVQTRDGIRCLLALDFDTAYGGQELSTPAADLAYAADRLLTSDPSDSERTTAELLNYISATWEEQDVGLREHAQDVARAAVRTATEVTVTTDGA